MEHITAQSIEEEVGKAILQEPLGVVTLRGVTYPVNHPSSATLIQVSRLCQKIPAIDEKGNILYEVLKKASECDVIGKIIATLILGAKRIKENHIIEIPHTRSCGGAWRHFFGLPDKVITEIEKVSEIEYFSSVLLEDFTPSQLMSLADKLFAYSEVGDFFALTTSLSVANLLKSTKEVVKTFGE